MNTSKEALCFVFAMGGVILFCRVFPFLFFSKGETSSPRLKAFLNYIEGIVPPAAMTVLAFNAIGTSILNNSKDGLLVFACSLFTALAHLWKRNTLISIIGGTALYMILKRLVI